MKVCICSLSNRPILYEKTFTIMERYCKKWGHHFFPYYELLATDRHPAWGKIALCKKLLETQLFDYVIWIDDDIVLTNMEKNIVDFINETNDKCISIQKENKRGKSINSGFMIMKNDPTTLKILNDVWVEGETSKYKTNHPWEQGVIKPYVYKNITHFHLFNNKELQTFHPGCGSWAGKWRWEKGEFSCHLAGIGMKRRILLIDELIKNISNTNE